MWNNIAKRSRKSQKVMWDKGRNQGGVAGNWAKESPRREMQRHVGSPFGHKRGWCCPGESDRPAGVRETILGPKGKWEDTEHF